MRYLEVRRHSQRNPPNQHLTQWGVDLARHLGEDLGPFEHVVTSPLPRCIETAVAMGFEVNKTMRQLAGDDQLGETFPCMSEVDWKAGYAAFTDQIASLKPLEKFVTEQAILWKEIVQALPDETCALLIGHGGAFLDGTVVFCFPQANHSTWGASSSYCEGVRLGFEGGRFTTAEILRVSVD